MYETFFHLYERPFAAAARADHYFPAATIEDARAGLIRCVQRAEGIGLVIGPTGTGKTLLCNLLAEQCKNAYQVALLTSGQLGTRRALLQAILYEVGLPYRGMDEGELRLALVDHITLSEDCPQGVVLIVDEAHLLPLRLLDEVRMLTNLMRDGQTAVRAVLAGGRALEERFSSPKLESFNQRLTARCYLESFNRDETQAYIDARLKAVGDRGLTIFSPATCQAVYKATEGVPRLVNQVCDHAMVLAYANGLRKIEPAQIEEAWADLQQLPMPWHEEATKSGGEGVIEFGGLEDDEPVASREHLLTGQSESQPESDVSDFSDSESEPVESRPALWISGETTPGELEDPEDCLTLPAQDIAASADCSGDPLAAREEELAPEAQLRQIQQMLSDVEDEFQPHGSIGPEVELVFDLPERPFSEPFEKEEVVSDRYVAPAAEVKPAETVAAVATLPKPIGKVSPPTLPITQCLPVSQSPADDSDLLVVEEGYEESPVLAGKPLVAVRRHEYGRLFARLRQG